MQIDNSDTVEMAKMEGFLGVLTMDCYRRLPRTNKKVAPRKQQCASIRESNLIHTEERMTNIRPFSKSKVKIDGAREHPGHLREQLEDAEILSSSFCLHLSLYRIGM